MFEDVKKVKDPVSLLKSIYAKLTPNDKFAYLSGFIICLLVNMFAYTNTCFVHDSIQIYNDSTGITNGRILVGPLLELTNRMQIPWVIGLITCFLMGFVVMLMSRLFLLRRKISILFLAGFVITSETMFISHAYFNSVYIYVLSLLLAAAGVYIADYKKIGYLYSVLFLCLSMFCYQAYISTAIALFLFKLLIHLYKDDNKIKKQLLLTAKYASICILSVAIYFGIWQLVLRLTKQSVSDYHVYQNASDIAGISGLYERLSYALSMAFQFVSRDDIFGTHPVLFFCWFFINIFCILLILIKAIRKKRIIFSLLYASVFFLTVNFMYLLTGSALSGLTAFSMIIPVLLFLYYFDNIELSKVYLKNIISWFTSVICSVIIISQAVFGNSLYLKMKTNYDNAWSYSTRLIDRLEQTEGFDKNSKLIIIGNKFHVTEYDSSFSISNRLDYTSRIDGIFHDYYINNNALTYALTVQWFIQQEMDIDMDIQVNPKKYYSLDFVKDMPVFPSDGSIVQYNGFYIVKVADI